MQDSGHQKEELATLFFFFFCTIDLFSCFSVNFTSGLTSRDLLSSEEEVAPGMRLWRKSLGQVRSSAQLSLCIQQLQKSIAWERAIMKVVGVTCFHCTFLSLSSSQICLPYLIAYNKRHHAVL